MSLTDTLPSPGIASPAIASSLATATETGALGVYQLKRLWSRTMAGRQGRFPPTTLHDRHLDNLVVHAIGLGLEQTAAYLGRSAPTFEAFEHWIVATTGGIEPERAARINAAVIGAEMPQESRRALAAIEASDPVLTAAELGFWDEHGYVVLHDAVPPATREAAAQALWAHLGASPNDPDSWYGPSDHGIMVQYFQHPAFTAIRRAPRIQKAFAQLWGTPDLWATTDRVGFNPPERDGFMFPGPHLHWDVSVENADPVRHRRHSLSGRYAARAGRVYAGARLPALGRRLAQGVAGRRASAPTESLRLGSAADRRPRRRSDHLASGAAARRQPQPRRQTASGTVRQHVPDADRTTGGVDLSY